MIILKHQFTTHEHESFSIGNTIYIHFQGTKCYRLRLQILYEKNILSNKLSKRAGKSTGNWV